MMDKRNISAYPTSIFPAAFVLSCSNIVSEGPLKFDPDGRVLRPNEREWTHEDAISSDGSRIINCATAEAVATMPSEL